MESSSAIVRGLIFKETDVPHPKKAPMEFTVQEKDSFNMQLYNIGSDSKIKIVTIMIQPNFPEVKFKYRPLVRQFQISSSLVTRPSFSQMGELLNDEIPLLVFQLSINKTKSDIVSNWSSDHYSVNNPSMYSSLTLTELEPIPIEHDNNPRPLDYFFDVTVHLSFQVPV